MGRSASANCLPPTCLLRKKSATLPTADIFATLCKILSEVNLRGLETIATNAPEGPGTESRGSRPDAGPTYLVLPEAQRRKPQTEAWSEGARSSRVEDSQYQAELYQLPPRLTRQSKTAV